MHLSTSLKGRLRNTNLPKTNVLHPLFEAVVNSIHAIDERIQSNNLDMSDAFVKIIVIRSNQIGIEETSKPDIVGFEIIDNGIGFNQQNFESFQTLDSEYKLAIGGRGVGRLLWLKAFKKVVVKSIFIENSLTQQRSFNFNALNGLYNVKVQDIESDQIETSVILNQLNKEYEKYLPKTISSISHSLLEHCLWYFLRSGGAPDISIIDDDETLSLNEEYDSYMLTIAETVSFNIKSKLFELTHVKLKTSSRNKHAAIYTAANRVVSEESLVGKIPGLFGMLTEDGESFSYMCFVTSDYLDERVNSERIGFNISESLDGFFSEDEISFSEIRKEVLKCVAEYLEDFLTENKRLGLEKVINFVETKAPRYRSILNRIAESDKIVDPNISDKDLELRLHSHLVSIESELLAEGHDLMKPNGFLDEMEYTKKIEDYLLKASDLKKSDLANYVTHRKVIIDLFTKAIQIKEDGKYVKEDVIHRLIMPMQKDSTELFSNDSNLWLIDERLAFHNYLASDKSLKSMPITDSVEPKEPDILSLNIYDNPLLVNEGQTPPLASITVVEIKRPMRNDAEQGEDKDPIEQALGYLNRIRAGKVKTATGRPIPNSENVPGFCYVIADITDSIKNRCEMLDMQVTSDKLGYFGYHKNYNAYIEVLSFDRLLNMAKERNRAFFDKLGLPTT